MKHITASLFGSWEPRNFSQPICSFPFCFQIWHRIYICIHRWNVPKRGNFSLRPLLQNCGKSFQPKSLETSCSLKQKATKPGSWMRWLGDQRRSAFFRSLDDDGWLVGAFLDLWVFWRKVQVGRLKKKGSDAMRCFVVASKIWCVALEALWHRSGGVPLIRRRCLWWEGLCTKMSVGSGWRVINDHHYPHSTTLNYQHGHKQIFVITESEIMLERELKVSSVTGHFSRFTMRYLTVD